jgi:hypothetical protein
MRWRRIAAVAAVILIGGAFLIGYVPEHRLRMAAEAQSRMVQEELATAEARIRMGELLGQALTIREVTMRQNYGQAQELSSSFFDGVQAEAARTPESAFRDALNEVLAKRDAVTAALTKADPGVVEILHMIELRVRHALGYTLPPEPAPR